MSKEKTPKQNKEKRNIPDPNRVEKFTLTPPPDLPKPVRAEDTEDNTPTPNNQPDNPPPEEPEKE